MGNEGEGHSAFLVQGKRCRLYVSTKRFGIFLE